MHFFLILEWNEEVQKWWSEKNILEWQQRERRI